jgi:hypothetical protein
MARHLGDDIAQPANARTLPVRATASRLITILPKH